ncbi:hypothetical protein [Vreelandella sp. EE7]
MSEPASYETFELECGPTQLFFYIKLGRVDVDEKENHIVYSELDANHALVGESQRPAIVFKPGSFALKLRIEDLQQAQPPSTLITGPPFGRQV